MFFKSHTVRLVEHKVEPSSTKSVQIKLPLKSLFISVIIVIIRPRDFLFSSNNHALL